MRGTLGRGRGNAVATDWVLGLEGEEQVGREKQKWTFPPELTQRSSRGLDWIVKRREALGNLSKNIY